MDSILAKYSPRKAELIKQALATFPCMQDHPALLSSEAGPSSSTDDSVSSSAVKAPAAKPAAKGKRVPKAKEEFDPEAGIYDDCNDIRRKIRAHLATGAKVTHFLRDIGGVNSNSYRRFMQASGPNAGQENGTFAGAYYFFEKKRIEEGKPKSAKRKRNEIDWGFDGHDTGRERKYYLCLA